jgi:hypothetical protein
MMASSMRFLLENVLEDLGGSQAVPSFQKHPYLGSIAAIALVYLRGETHKSGIATLPKPV